MKTIAWILLMIGLVIASLAASRIDDTLGVSALLFDGTFLLGMGAIIVSIVLNRVSVARKSKTDLSGRLILSDAKKNLEQVLSSLNTIAQNRATMPLNQAVQHIDRLLKNQLFDIVESRLSIIQITGYGSYAAFMSDFAIGERFISRSWSAGVDKYQEESFNYVEKAIPFFEKAQHTLDKISSANS
ncbi:MAG: hypothetical protein GY762_17725 [Proteobacteria bacterium]|nr:hypothetical protein [Pseudomonadota bacterium]